jgi:hypothetical protein
VAAPMSYFEDIKSFIKLPGGLEMEKKKDNDKFPIHISLHL